jgi:hypothetical protein
VRFRGVAGRVLPVGEAIPHEDGESPFPDGQQVAPPQYNNSRRGRGDLRVAGQPHVIVAGNGTVTLIGVVGKRVVFRDSEIFANSPSKLIVLDLKNGASNMLQLAESIIDFHLNFSHLVRPK